MNLKSQGKLFRHGPLQKALISLNKLNAVAGMSLHHVPPRYDQENLLLPDGNG